MNSHPFLTIFLPTLSFHTTPELSTEDLLFFLDINLSKTEQVAVSQLFSFYDLDNVRAWILGLPMTTSGNIPHDELKDLLEDSETKIVAIDRFLARYPTNEERILNLPLLTKFFIQEAISSFHPFLRKYFSFENTTRILLSFLRGQDQNRQPEESIKTLPFNVHVVAEWPEIYQKLYSCLQKKAPSCEIEKAVAFWKFNAIERLGEESPSFSFDNVLSYLIRLHLVETRLGMKDKSHLKNLELLVKVAQ